MTKRKRRQMKKPPPKKPEPSPAAVSPGDDRAAPQRKGNQTSTEQQPSERHGENPAKLDKWTRGATIVMGVATVAIAVITAIYTYAALKQLSVLDGQLQQMQESAQLEQRAWLGISEATHGPIEPSKPVEGEFVFTNTGKTPATILGTGRAVRVYTPEVDVNEKAQEWDQTTTLFDTPVQKCLAPNASMMLHFHTDREKPLSDKQAAAIESGQLVVYVIGKVIYKDIFGATHETRFCAIVRPEDQTMKMLDVYNHMD